MKIVYDVLVKVKKEKELEWVTWMTEYHIPEVCQVANVSDALFTKIENGADENGHYQISYLFNSQEELDRYLKEKAPALRLEHHRKFGDVVEIERRLGILMKWFETQS